MTTEIWMVGEVCTLISSEQRAHVSPRVQIADALFIGLGGTRFMDNYRKNRAGRLYSWKKMPWMLMILQNSSRWKTTKIISYPKLYVERK